ncbi:spore maturation protein B [Hydrogenispora ethanolica]|jgi:spore maturation protein B|uniref:Spore maturation protein B n=1 Tax=Hydrogenispora ethanolica TaxID=1082276 RepID=A0A4R1RTR2_HYDET|nr:nucleoside recognition domain-containing protein [Hydrogenispora ethanolica]TCL69933.1 spore maturation protein B [Hydrogenispora ethanolica]
MYQLFSTLSQWAIPILLLAIFGAALRKKVAVYEVFIQGALEGLKITVKLTPYILAIFVAVGIFRSSGALNLFIAAFKPLLQLCGIHPDLLTLGLLKPLSGSAALGITADLLSKYGPDSKLGLTASMIQGSSETTFYIYSLYLGAIPVKDSRHILLTGLVCETVAILLALIFGLGLVR